MYKIFPGTFTNDGRKVPIKEVKWQEQATDDQNVIATWNSLHSHKIKFWGVPTGRMNNLLVLDVDVKSGGLETIKNYHVPKTLSQTTLSGGTHYFFRYPDDGNTYGNRVGFDNGLDIRGEGGYVSYYGTDGTPLAEAPQWLLDHALSNKKEVDLNNIVSVAPEIAQTILDDACENIINAPDGESNNVLNVEAYRVGQLIPSNSIDYERAFNALFSAAKERGKPDYEAKATIQSGFKGGSSQPYTSPFGNVEPELLIPEQEQQVNERWTPQFFSKYDLTNMRNLRRPQIFKDWSTADICITTADGGTGKTTLKLCEAIALALGEPFLGFECKEEGRTLFITGEDTKEKLGAMLGAILKQMNIMDDKEKVNKVMNNVLVKKDSELCLVSKTKEGFYSPNKEALDKILQAIEDIKPKLIVFDPIAMFWGPESGLNDMTKAVAKLMGELVEKSGACVEAINHMGKASSTSKDMSQFAGRGGTGLPSHARVSRVLRPVFEDEFEELTGFELTDEKSAIMCNINKFSDGSPLYNKPFLIVRDGYLFSRVTLVEQKVKEEQDKMSDTERVFTFIKSERDSSRFPNKAITTAHFQAQSDKISKDRTNRALEYLMYMGHMGEKLKMIENPDIEAGGKVFIITDSEGKELT